MRRSIFARKTVAAATGFVALAFYLNRVTGIGGLG